MAELRKLMNQLDIVIKKADKGGAVVTVLSRNHDRAMIYEHRNNETTYQKVDGRLDDGNAVIATFDVVRLYTHTFGLALGTRYFLLKCEEDIRGL